MTHRRPTLAIAFALAVAAAGLGAAPAAAGGRGSESIAEALGVPTIKLTTPKSGGGRRPVFAWKAVDGAGLYQLVVLDKGGDALWAWDGAGTSVPLGGGTTPRPKAAPGPVVRKGCSWSVIAIAADGTIIAASAQRPIAP